MKYFLIAGEASGDLHASNLMHSIKSHDRKAEFHFIGGDKMTEIAGTAPLQHYSSMNFMGLFAVLAHLGSIRRIFRNAKRDIRAFEPNAIILVDYAGFNLRIARFASKMRCKVFYYISPKVWAWRKSRIQVMKRCLTKLFVIFPFEPGFFREHGMEVEYHGNPLMDAIALHRKDIPGEEVFRRENGLGEKPLIALLAGSRKQEIQLCLPEMIHASGDFSGYQFVVAGAPSVDKKFYEKVLRGTEIGIVYDKTYDLLEYAEAAVVTSGTATLETALLGVPQVVVYKTGKLTYLIGKLFVNFEFFSLVNLIAGKKVVKEVLQSDLSMQVRNELHKILEDEIYRQSMMASYDVIQGMIGEPGVSDRVAVKMIELIEK